MNLPQFIFFDTPALPGAGFVFCTNNPFYIGKVWKFYSNEKLKGFIQEKAFTDWNYVLVPGYNIMLTYFDNMMKHFHPPKGDIKEHLQQMTRFYLSEKIQPHAAAFTKFKQQAGR